MFALTALNSQARNWPMFISHSRLECSECENMRLHSGICPCCTESRMRVMSLCFALLGDGFGFVIFLFFFFPRLFFIKVVLCIHRLSFFEYAYIYTYFDPPLIKLLLSPLCSRLTHVWNAEVSQTLSSILDKGVGGSQQPM